MIFFSGIITCIVVAHLLKQVMFEYKRPEGACNCGTLNNGGMTTDQEPGMPSGHVATVTFFFVYLALYRHNMKDIPTIEHAVYYLVAVASISLMALARYHKKCHDIPQIIGGVVLGFTMALFYWVCFLEGRQFIKRVLK